MSLPMLPGTIPGLSGLPPANQVGEDYQLKPFEYFRNEGGQRYVQNALSNPGEVPGYTPPPPPGAPPAPVGGALPPPQTGGGEPYPPDPMAGGANPWASFFQGLSRTQGPGEGLAGGRPAPQTWQQTQRGFNPGSPSVSLPPPSPYPGTMKPAVMPPNKATFGQMATPEAGNQTGMSMPSGQSLPPWFKQFQAMFAAPQQSALPQPMANAGYFPPPSLPVQGQPNGGPG